MKRYILCISLSLLAGCSGPNMRALKNDFNGSWGPLAIVGVPFALAFDAVDYTGAITYPSGSGTTPPTSHTSHTSSYSGDTAPVVNAGPTVSSTVNSWNSTCTGTWSAPQEVFFNPTTHQAKIPIQVTYNKPSPNSFSRLTFSLEGGDYQNPLVGTATMVIGQSDPMSGTKTVMMWATANPGTYNAIITVSGASLTNAWAGYGEEQKITLRVP